MSTRQHTRELLAQFNRYPQSPPPPNRYTLISDCDAVAANDGSCCSAYISILYYTLLLIVGDDIILFRMHYTVLLIISLRHDKPVKKC